MTTAPDPTALLTACRSLRQRIRQGHARMAMRHLAVIEAAVAALAAEARATRRATHRLSRREELLLREAGPRAQPGGPLA